MRDARRQWGTGGKRSPRAHNQGSGWRPRALLGLALTLALAGCSTPPGAASRVGSHTPTVTATRGGGASTGAPTAGPGATVAPGSVWGSLAARPLRLPALAPGAACPTTPARQGVSPDFPYAQGAGPVYAIAQRASGAVVFNSAASLGDSASGYGGFKAIWEIQPAYTGPVLIRGARIDGPGALEFNGGLGQPATTPSGMEPRQSELRIDGQSVSPPSWPTWVAFTRLTTAGCYAYQVDGTSFEEMIVFQAVAV